MRNPTVQILQVNWVWSVPVHAAFLRFSSACFSTLYLGQKQSIQHRAAGLNGRGMPGRERNYGPSVGASRVGPGVPGGGSGLPHFVPCAKPTGHGQSGASPNTFHTIAALGKKNFILCDVLANYLFRYHRKKSTHKFLLQNAKRYKERVKLLPSLPPPCLGPWLYLLWDNQIYILKRTLYAVVCSSTLGSLSITL